VRALASPARPRQLTAMPDELLLSVDFEDWHQLAPPAE
jgi:hypothetical protein